MNTIDAIMQGAWQATPWIVVIAATAFLLFLAVVPESRLNPGLRPLSRLISNMANSGGRLVREQKWRIAVFVILLAAVIYTFPSYFARKGVVSGIMAMAVLIASYVFVSWALGQKGRWRTVAIVIIALFSLTVVWTVAQSRHATAVKHSAQASINLSAAKTVKKAVDKDVASMRESVYRAKRTIATETGTINRRDSMIVDDAGRCERQGQEPYIAVVLKDNDGRYSGDSVCVPERDIEPAPALIPPTGSYGIGDYAIPIYAGEETGKIVPAGRAKVTAVNGQGFSIWLESGGIISLAQGESAWVNEPFRIKNGSTQALASLAVTG